MSESHATDEPVSCARCGGELEEGFAVGGHNVQVRWVEGAPEHGVLGNIKLDEKRVYLVATYRCVECGGLESFARERSY